MEIILAGFNLDTEIIRQLAKNYSGANLTPETISASYARISRDGRPVNELRAASREEVEKARRSNQNIIFNMGHHSVAEHAVFNFDVLGVSRLCVEALEKFRLCSYTEKSQRYITLGRDYLIPEEISRSGAAEEFENLMVKENNLYEKLFKKIKANVFEENKKLAQEEKNKNLLEGWAKEDARYITSLAATTQLGMTVNARNLELMFRRFASDILAEVRLLGEKLYAAVEKIAPSVILFVAANPLDEKTYPALEKAAQKLLAPEKSVASEPEVKIVDFTPEADEKILAALLFKTSGATYEKCLAEVKKMSGPKKEELFKTSCRHLEFYDAVLREFEMSEITFSLIVSASCFAQLKRHRICTVIAQDYRPELGTTIPTSVKKAGAEADFQKIIQKANVLFEKLKPKIGAAAQYVLTNAHCRRVLIKTNLRELYHISRLREDIHAQWDIRQITTQMCGLAKKIAPLSLKLLGGKDKYPEVYEKIFGQPPKQKPPD